MPPSFDEQAEPRASRHGFGTIAEVDEGGLSGLPLPPPPPPRVGASYGATRLPPPPPPPSNAAKSKKDDGVRVLLSPNPIEKMVPGDLGFAYDLTTRRESLIVALEEEKMGWWGRKKKRKKERLQTKGNPGGYAQGQLKPDNSAT